MKSFMDLSGVIHRHPLSEKKTQRIQKPRGAFMCCSKESRFLSGHVHAFHVGTPRHAEESGSNGHQKVDLIGLAYAGRPGLL